MTPTVRAAADLIHDCDRMGGVNATYRNARPRRTGVQVDPVADLAEYDALLASVPEDYPGRALMLAHRAVLVEWAEAAEGGRA